MINGSEYMRRELMIRLVRAFDEGKLESEIDQIPVKMRPKNASSSRCCIYHDRAILKYRLMALLGFSVEEESDETRLLSSYLEEMLASSSSPSDPPLTVCTAACSACPPSAYIVTGNCRGCLARPCLYSCPKGAITIENQRSSIDYSKCVKCGKCMAACPFHAIIKTTVPCEEACPVGAIRKGEDGHARIDFDKCIFCGKCFNNCPFSAILERSQLLRVLLDMRKKEGPFAALIAPAATDQFPGTLEQLFTAVSKLGFDVVTEVALGAEVTTEREAAEFQEKMKSGQRIMTTSCCPAYVELVRRHIPDFLDKVSTTPSPMLHTARLVREKHPGIKTVFIGPCIAKRHEAARTGEIDYVLTFEELGAMLAGRKIDLISQEKWELARPASATARNYSKSCGVTNAVLSELMKEAPGFKLNSKFINGIDKKSLTLLKLYAAGKLPANFLEVMACDGGCVNGPCSLAR